MCPRLSKLILPSPSLYLSTPFGRSIIHFRKLIFGYFYDIITPSANKPFIIAN